MNKIKLSVVLATHNEQENLSQCLNSVKDIADEIVTADGGSTDNTVSIAKKFGAKIFATTNKPNFHINKNLAIDAAKGDWILQLDADEVVSPELAQEIKTITYNLEPSTYTGYWINRKNWFLDRFLTKGGQYPDPTLRLYKRGSGRLPARDVHEQAVVKGPVGHLRSDLLHYRDTSFEKYLNGFNRYSSLLAGRMKNVPVNPLTVCWFLFLKPVYVFLNIYVRHRGLVDGFAGFVFALFSGLIWGVAFIKYWQITYYPADIPLPKLE